MTTFRFMLFVAGVFALTFLGVSWARKGLPMMTAPVIVPLQPDSRLPVFQSVRDGPGRDWESPKTSQSDGNASRDKLRLELLQASNAYELSPCDETIRKNFVAALTDYARAWHELAHCRPGIGGCSSSSDERFDVAAVAFGTPADIRVQEALHKAVGQGGLWRDDFPAPLRDYVSRLASPWYGKRPPACVAALQARRQQ